MKEKNEKLIFVNKVGHSTKGDTLYEFVFTDDPENIPAKEWGWDTSPASSNAEFPTNEHISSILSLRTNLFDLNCLCDSVDRPYIFGYHTIQALAYEDEDAMRESNPEYESPYEDSPLLVFHYGMTIEQVKEALYERDVVLKGEDFVASKPKAKTTTKAAKKVETEESEEGSSDDHFFEIKF